MRKLSRRWQGTQHNLPLKTWGEGQCSLTIPKVQGPLFLISIDLSAPLLFSGLPIKSPKSYCCFFEIMITTVSKETTVILKVVQVFSYTLFQEPSILSPKEPKLGEAWRSLCTPHMEMLNSERRHSPQANHKLMAEAGLEPRGPTLAQVSFQVLHQQL